MAEIKNYMQNLVERNLDSIAKSTACCLCDRCRMDIIAIALNSLPSKYIVSEEGEVYAKASALQQQIEVDIIAATVKAVKIVSEKPRHF